MRVMHKTTRRRDWETRVQDSEGTGTHSSETTAIGTRRMSKYTAERTVSHHHHGPRNSQAASGTSHHGPRKPQAASGTSHHGPRNSPGCTDCGIVVSARLPCRSESRLLTLYTSVLNSVTAPKSGRGLFSPASCLVLSINLIHF